MHGRIDPSAPSIGMRPVEATPVEGWYHDPALDQWLPDLGGTREQAGGAPDLARRQTVELGRYDPRTGMTHESTDPKVRLLEYRQKHRIPIQTGVKDYWNRDGDVRFDCWATLYTRPPIKAAKKGCRNIRDGEAAVSEELLDQLGTDPKSGMALALAERGLSADAIGAVLDVLAAHAPPAEERERKERQADYDEEGGWEEDLTQDGDVEANPGPAAWIILMTGSGSWEAAEHNMEKVLAKYPGIKPGERPVLWTFCETMGVEYPVRYQPLQPEEERPTPAPPGGKRANPNAGQQPQPRQDRRRGKAAEALHNAERAVKLAQAAKDEDEAFELALRTLECDFGRTLVQVAAHRFREAGTPAAIWLRCKAKRLGSDATLAALLVACGAKSAQNFFAATGLVWPEDPALNAAYDEELASGHNALMHSLNGNAVVPTAPDPAGPGSVKEEAPRARRTLANYKGPNYSMGLLAPLAAVSDAITGTSTADKLDQLAGGADSAIDAVAASAAKELGQAPTSLAEAGANTTDERIQLAARLMSEDPLTRASAVAEVQGKDVNDVGIAGRAIAPFLRDALGFKHVGPGLTGGDTHWADWAAFDRSLHVEPGSDALEREAQVHDARYAAAAKDEDLNAADEIMATNLLRAGGMKEVVVALALLANAQLRKAGLNLTSPAAARYGQVFSRLLGQGGSAAAERVGRAAGPAKDLTREGVEPNPGPVDFTDPMGFLGEAIDFLAAGYVLIFFWGTDDGWVRDLLREGVEPNPGPPPKGGGRFGAFAKKVEMLKAYLARVAASTLRPNLFTEVRGDLSTRTITSYTTQKVPMCGAANASTINLPAGDGVTVGRGWGHGTAWSAQPVDLPGIFGPARNYAFSALWDDTILSISSTLTQFSQFRQPTALIDTGATAMVANITDKALGPNIPIRLDVAPLLRLRLMHASRQMPANLRGNVAWAEPRSVSGLCITPVQCVLTQNVGGNRVWFPCSSTPAVGPAIPINTVRARAIDATAALQMIAGTLVAADPLFDVTTWDVTTAVVPLPGPDANASIVNALLALANMEYPFTAQGLSTTNYAYNRTTGVYQVQMNGTATGQGTAAATQGYAGFLQAQWARVPGPTARVLFVVMSQTDSTGQVNIAVNGRNIQIDRTMAVPAVDIGDVLDGLVTASENIAPAVWQRAYVSQMSMTCRGVPEADRAAKLIAALASVKFHPQPAVAGVGAPQQAMALWEMRGNAAYYPPTPLGRATGDAEALLWGGFLLAEDAFGSSWGYAAPVTGAPYSGYDGKPNWRIPYCPAVLKLLTARGLIVGSADTDTGPASQVMEPQGVDGFGSETILNYMGLATWMRAAYEDLIEPLGPTLMDKYDNFNGGSSALRSALNSAVTAVCMQVLGYECLQTTDYTPSPTSKAAWAFPAAPQLPANYARVPYTCLASVDILPFLGGAKDDDMALTAPATTAMAGQWVKDAVPLPDGTVIWIVDTDVGSKNLDLLAVLRYADPRIWYGINWLRYYIAASSILDATIAQPWSWLTCRTPNDWRDFTLQYAAAASALPVNAVFDDVYLPGGGPFACYTKDVNFSDLALALGVAPAMRAFAAGLSDSSLPLIQSAGMGTSLPLPIPSLIATSRSLLDIVAGIDALGKGAKTVKGRAPQSTAAPVPAPPSQNPPSAAGTEGRK
jgi:hypothetical protein